MAVSDIRLRDRPRVGSRFNLRTIALGAVASLAIASTAIAGSVVQGNFNRSPAYPTTPNNKFPQETAQIIELKQRKVLEQQGTEPTLAQTTAAGGVLGTAAAFVGFGEISYDRANQLGLAGSAIAAAGSFVCFTGFGCAVGGPLIALGTVIGLGGAAMCVVADCSIQMDGNGVMSGADIRTLEATRSTEDQDDVPSIQFQFGQQSNTVSLMTRFGVLQQFVFKQTDSGAGYQQYRVGFIMPFTPAGSSYPDNYARSAVGDYVITRGGGNPTPLTPRCDNMQLATTGCTAAWQGRGDIPGSTEPCKSAGYSHCTFYASVRYYSNPNQVVLQTYKPVQELNILEMGTGSALPPNASAKPLSNELVASIANAVWEHQGAQAPVPYSPGIAIQPAEVASYRQQYPDRASNLGDLGRAISSPGQLPRVGPVNNPAPVPSQVEVVNPSTGQEPADGEPAKERDPEEELDEDAGLLGDVMQPAREFLAGPFARFMTPGITLPPAACPVMTIDVPTLLGRQDQSKPVSSAFLCDWFDSIRPYFIAILRMFYVFAAMIIVFKRS